MSIGVVSGVIVAGSGALLLARLRGNSGQLVTAESLTSIAWTATNLNLGTVAGSGTFTVATTVFDTLVQNDPRWIMDSVTQPGPDGTFGYNFAATVPAATFAITSPTGQPMTVLSSTVYRVDVLFTPLTGEVFRVPFQPTAVPVFA